MADRRLPSRATIPTNGGYTVQILCEHIAIGAARYSRRFFFPVN